MNSKNYSKKVPYYLMLNLQTSLFTILELFIINYDFVVFETDAGKQPEMFGDKNSSISSLCKKCASFFESWTLSAMVAAPIIVGQLLHREWHYFHWQSEGTDHSFLQQ